MYHNKFTLWNRKLKINICKAKFSSHKQRLFGVPFATIAKKTYTCKKILLDFHSVRKEIRNNLQTFAVTAVKILNKSFLFYLITGRYYSGKCWSQLFFSHTIMLVSMKQMFLKMFMFLIISIIAFQR